MEESDKLPLKRVELPLTKFNEVAIPHHLDLLRQHKVNIVKYESDGEWARVRSEQARARRVAAQLRALLADLEALRARVRAADLPRFDSLTRSARERTLKAIVEYLEMSATTRASPADEGVGSVTSTESVGLVPVEEEHAELQLHHDHQELALREREEALRGWSALQAEVLALHAAWQHAQLAALQHRDQVTEAASTVELAGDNVQAARQHLSAAERLRAGLWVCGGAAAGALAGGPLGLVAGVKAGAAAALAGGVLGALGVRALGRRAAPRDPPPDKRD